MGVNCGVSHQAGAAALGESDNVSHCELKFSMTTLAHDSIGAATGSTGEFSLNGAVDAT